MKTKAELLAEISELAEKHALELPSGLKGLNYPAVEELLGKLQAQVAALPAAGALVTEVTEADAGAAPPSDAGAGDDGPGDPPPPVEQPPRERRFVVAPGRSLCGVRGLLGPGDRVRRSDFGGEPKLEDFVRAGYVVEA